MHKKNIGTFGEALVVAQILEHELAAFTDFGDNSKIDVIVLDSNHIPHRVQVKCVGREPTTPNVSKLYLYKSGPNYQFLYQQNMLDWFAVVDVTTKKIAWIPSSILTTHSSQLTLRHDAPISKGGSSSVKFFDDYVEFPFN
jgi:hypothetical protein